MQLVLSPVCQMHGLLPQFSSVEQTSIRCGDRHISLLKVLKNQRFSFHLSSIGIRDYKGLLVIIIMEGGRGVRSQDDYVVLHAKKRNKCLGDCTVVLIGFLTGRWSALPAGEPNTLMLYLIPQQSVDSF